MIETISYLFRMKKKYNIVGIVISDRRSWLRLMGIDIPI